VGQRSNGPVDARGPNPASASRTISVLYFAALRDLAGVGEESVELPADDCSVSAILAELERKHAGLRGRLSAVRVAVNEEFVPLGSQVRGGDVVALIPPVSGG
jgi:molybdopterin converting factor subunit 1